MTVANNKEYNEQKKSFDEQIQSKVQLLEETKEMQLVEEKLKAIKERTAQVPSVGRVVHYIAYGTPGGEFPQGIRRAAIITEVKEPSNPYSKVGLCVLNPTGQFFNPDVPFSEGDKPGSWSWPPYMPAVQV